MAADPVFVTERGTLIALMGLPAYEELVIHCEARMAALAAARAVAAKTPRGGGAVTSPLAAFAPHPADPA